MSITPVACEQCGLRVDSSITTYSSAGQLVCPSCAAKGDIAAGDARVADSRRSLRIAMIITVALIVGVPGLMIAAGAGKYVVYGLVGIGLLALVGGGQARRMYVVRNPNADPTVARGSAILMAVGVGAILLGMALDGVVSRMGK